MAEYWVSQAKKFCEYCKCWIADNKASVNFHEGGKKHKENVTRKLADIRKQGAKTAQKKQEDSDAFKEMERAALAAFEKDLASNPELAAQYGVKEKPKKKEEEFKPSYEPLQGPSLPPPGFKPEVDPTMWEETTSPEGHTYYWHTESGETTWEKPEGYVSPSDRLKPSPEEKTKESSQNTQKAEEVPTHEIPLPQEKKPPVKHATKRPARPQAYGQWETVTYTEPEYVDLQLPVTKESEEIAAPIVMHSEPKKMKFKEKTVSSLSNDSSSGAVSFKKRKFGGARSLKTRTEDS
ncbi:unnamed protein product [Owenia fusiformis]|uniref:Uncharacterized protein n=1 Tax=Owenia fusiformis TaxID=6347 RepID=A0A8J1TJY6_OWEFU|nr:unnamed protein product [Owenia fusiformis]